MQFYRLYLLSSAEEASINTKLELQNDEPIPLPDQNTLMVIKDLKNKLSLIENTQKGESSFSQRIINEITLKKCLALKSQKFLIKIIRKQGK